MSNSLNQCHYEKLTDWDDEGGEGVATDDTPIVHDVLRCDLPIRDKIG
jgi:hypothetical protein